MPQKQAFLALDVPKLFVPLRIRCSQQFAVHLEGIIHVAQEPSHRRRADGVLGVQLLLQLFETLAFPFFVTARIARRVFLEQSFKSGQNGRVFFFPPAAGRLRGCESDCPNALVPVRVVLWQWYSRSGP